MAGTGLAELYRDIQDGPTGDSSDLIDIPNGGSVPVEKHRLSQGPMTGNGGSAISIGAEGAINPPGRIIARDNNFVNQRERPTVFVRDLAATPARLSGNVPDGAVTPLAGAGTIQ